MPAGKIIANGYNLTLASLGLVEPEKTDHAEPEEILASVAGKEQKILDIIGEMRELVTGGKWQWPLTTLKASGVESLLAKFAPIDTTPFYRQRRRAKNFFYIALENIESGTGRLVGSTPGQGRSIKSQQVFSLGFNMFFWGKTSSLSSIRFIIPKQTWHLLHRHPAAHARFKIARRGSSWVVSPQVLVSLGDSSVKRGKAARCRDFARLIWRSYEIPVPPLAEQRRIVARGKR